MSCAFFGGFMLALIFFTVFWILIGFGFEWMIRKYTKVRDERRHAKYAYNHFRQTERFRRDISEWSH